MNLNGQSPQQEVQERMAESSPLAFLPRAIAAEDMRHTMAAYRVRVDTAQAMGLAALGFDDYANQIVESSTQANSNMGGITIHGDTHQHLYGQMLPPQQQQQPAPQPATPPAANGLTKFIGPALVGAGLLGSGAGGLALWDYFTSQSAEQPAAVQPDDETDWKLGVEVRDR